MKYIIFALLVLASLSSTNASHREPGYEPPTIEDFAPPANAEMFKGGLETIETLEKATNYNNNGSYEKALDYALRAEEGVYKHNLTITALGFTKSAISNIYFQLGDYKSAKTYFKESKHAYDEINANREKAETILIYANSQQKEGNFSKASKLYYEAFKTLKDAKKSPSRPLVFYDLSEAYYRIENYTMSRKSAKLALRDFKEYDNFSKVKSVSDRFNTYNGKQNAKLAQIMIGKTYYGEAVKEGEDDNIREAVGKLKIAENELRKASEYNSSKQYQINVLLQKGQLFSRKESYNDAIQSYGNALELERSVADNRPVGRSWSDNIELTKAYLEFEQGWKNAEELNLSQAVSHFGQAEKKFRGLSQDSYLEPKDLLKGYYYYSSSLENYFEFQSTADNGNLELARDHLAKAQRSFRASGNEELARDIVGWKATNLRENPLTDEYKLLLSGLEIYSVSYDKRGVKGRTQDIAINYSYNYQLSSKSTPEFKVCFKNGCSRWRDMSSKNSTIKISFEPSKNNLSGHPKIYLESDPQIPVSNIQPYLSESSDYEGVEIKARESIWWILDKISVIQGLLGGGFISLIFFIYKKKETIREKLRIKNEYF